MQNTQNIPIGEIAETVWADEQVLRLQEAYVRARVVTPKQYADARHVATATVGRCQMIVSWNFKHIVHWDKMPRYNAVNALEGYPSLSIFSPPEVVGYEEEDL